jgi:hypothetical protein
VGLWRANGAVQKVPIFADGELVHLATMLDRQAPYPSHQKVWSGACLLVGLVVQSVELRKERRRTKPREMAALVGLHPFRRRAAAARTGPGRH